MDCEGLASVGRLACRHGLGAGQPMNGHYVPGADPPASSPRLRRMHRYTFAPNGWLQSVARAGTGLWGTQFLTIGCPDDFFAVRLGFPNITRFSYTVPSIAVCPSTSWNDYANPTGPATPVMLTSLNAGADVDRIVTATDVPGNSTVGPNSIDRTSGEPSIAAWSWTDWCAVSSVAPDPRTGMRVLMIRHTVANNNGELVTFGNGRMIGWQGEPSINKGYDFFVAVLITAGTAQPLMPSTPNCFHRTR